MTQEKIVITLILVIACPILVLSTEGIRECGGLPTPHLVNISDCAKAPCPLYRAEMISTFTSGGSIIFFYYLTCSLTR